MASPDTLTTDPLHRRRACVLGVLAVMALVLAAGWTLRSLSAVSTGLNRRATISTVDATPLVIRAILLITVLWAITLIVLSLRTLRSAARVTDNAVPVSLPAGVVGRIALVLLAATMTTTLAARPVSAYADVASQVGSDRPPVPAFGIPTGASLTSTPDPGFPSSNGSAPRSATTDCAPAPGWTASAPAPTGHRGAASAPLVTGCAGSAQDTAEIAVRRGDSLWVLVARHLHTDDPAVIAAEWPRWYTANRAVIGPDPDLLQVGQILHLPVPAGPQAALSTSAGDPR